MNDFDDLILRQVTSSGGTSSQVYTLHSNLSAKSTVAEIATSEDCIVAIETKAEYSESELEAKKYLAEWLVSRIPSKHIDETVQFLESKAAIAPEYPSVQEAGKVSIVDVIRQQNEPNFLEQEILSTFVSHRQEAFEAGTESGFDKELAQYLSQNLGDTLDILTRLISGKAVSDVVASRALKTIGEIHDPSSVLPRSRFLQALLSNSCASIRYGATLGLSYLPDQEILTALTIQVNDESDPLVKECIESLIASIEGDC